MSDQPGRARRPLSTPFSRSDAAVDEPLGERLLPIERHGAPFAVPAPAPAARPVVGGRRPLGEGGLRQDSRRPAEPSGRRYDGPPF
ncbi:hypothetical protein ABTY61_27995 [Kitasatospora sp. NPDC096128]|uniref:hypothetical protein n=1 Tax=Kitasatospora sp. NPDC096128 TaxID=3155547 RepID=UPI00332248F8